MQPFHGRCGDLQSYAIRSMSSWFLFLFDRKIKTGDCQDPGALAGYRESSMAYGSHKAKGLRQANTGRDGESVPG